MKYGTPFLYPGLNMVKVNEQVNIVEREKNMMTYENVLRETIIVINKKNNTNYTKEDVIGKSRKTEIVEIRHCACYILSINEIGSLKAIGRYFGGRDHSTVINARRVWSGYIEMYKNYRMYTNMILRALDV